MTLGKQIVQALSLDNSVDTLGRWMAHRVAELIERAEQAQTQADKDAAQRECTDLIMRLWERRYTWPHGQPLAKIADFLEKFTKESVSSYLAQANPDENTWVGILPILKSLQKLEERICRHAAIADLSKEDLEKERKWLEENNEDLSTEESQIIEIFLELHEQFLSDNYVLGKIKAPNFASLLPEERTKLVHEALANINAERQTLLMSINSLDDKQNNNSTEIE